MGYSALILAILNLVLFMSTEDDLYGISSVVWTAAWSVHLTLNSK